MATSNITFSKPVAGDFTAFGLGRFNTCAAIRNGVEVLCLIGEDKPYLPAGGKSTLKEIIATCEEGVTYYFKSFK